jgi:GTPase
MRFLGVGTVVSGTCYKGRIQINDNLLLGPDLIGQFKPVAIKGIHRKRLPVKECRRFVLFSHFLIIRITFICLKILVVKLHLLL